MDSRLSRTPVPAPGPVKVRDLIRWEPAPETAGALYGFVAGHGHAAFRITPPGRAESERDWLLSAYLAPGGLFRYGKTEAEAKQQAETWLREFVASLGAVFPGDRTPARDWLCSLSDGDLITIQWSGELRRVAVVVTEEDVALRDLTEDEVAELAAEMVRTEEDR